MNDNRADQIGGGIIAVGIAGVFASFAVVSWQSILWLRQGDWPRITILDVWHWAGLAYPDSTGWFGVDKMIGWTLDSSLSAALLWGGLAVGMAGIVCAVALKS